MHFDYHIQEIQNSGQGSSKLQTTEYFSVNIEGFLSFRNCINDQLSFCSNCEVCATSLIPKLFSLLKTNTTHSCGVGIHLLLAPFKCISLTTATWLITTTQRDGNLKMVSSSSPLLENLVRQAVRAVLSVAKSNFCKTNYENMCSCRKRSVSLICWSLAYCIRRTTKRFKPYLKYRNG